MTQKMPKQRFPSILLLVISTSGRIMAWAPDSIRDQQFALHIDKSKLLSIGGALPPMVEVPCSGSPLRAMIKPPNLDGLYDWYVSRNMADSDPSWAILWPTAVSLAHYLQKNPSIVQDKRVVELGAGLSLCGLTAAALGAKSVVISDREPYALHCALATANMNQLSNIRAALIDWEEGHDIPEVADVVIASDVLYDKETIKAFGAACKRISLSHGGLLLITDPKVERFLGARSMLREALDGVELEIIDLPRPKYNIPGQTPDAKDHFDRMQEKTILMKCIL